MTKQKWLQEWLKEDQYAFQGWDFSHIKTRWQEEQLTWSYEAIVKEYLHPFDWLLDMGTGGGEFLLSLGHPYENTAVTEAWQPNIKLCLERLQPLGIQVHPIIDDAALPFADNCFDIILNRHEAYDLSEVKRILKPNGYFITQQVGGNDCATLRERLNLEVSVFDDFSLQTELQKFRNYDFDMKYNDECFPELCFLDVGAIVFYAKIITWSFPKFSVSRNMHQLYSLQERLVQDGFISTMQHRFIIVAQNM